MFHGRGVAPWAWEYGHLPLHLVAPSVQRRRPSRLLGRVRARLRCRSREQRQVGGRSVAGGGRWPRSPSALSRAAWESGRGSRC